MLPQYARHQPGINEPEHNPEKNKRSDINFGKCCLADLCEPFSVMRHSAEDSKLQSPRQVFPGSALTWQKLCALYESGERRLPALRFSAACRKRFFAGKLPA